MTQNKKEKITGAPSQAAEGREFRTHWRGLAHSQRGGGSPNTTSRKVRQEGGGVDTQRSHLAQASKWSFYFSIIF